MKYYMITAKCGHVGTNNYYKATFFEKAENGKAAALYVRNHPRVKHDRKDAIISVTEIDDFLFTVGRDLNNAIPYFSCNNIQEQRKYFFEIENNIFREESEVKKVTKKHGLRKRYNDDPEYELIKNKHNISLNIA